MEKHISMGQYSTGGELKTELKRLNDELSQTERGTPERMEILGKINMLKHNNPELKERFNWGGAPGERFFDVTEEDIKNLKSGEQQVEVGHWVLIKIGDNEYEATRDGLYMEVFANLEDMLNRVNQIDYYEYDEELSKENDQETFTNESGKVREYKKGGKIYNYKGVEVSIRPASKGSKKFIVWDIKTDQQFSNEKFGSKKDAEDFVKENKMVLATKK